MKYQDRFYFYRNLYRQHGAGCWPLEDTRLVHRNTTRAQDTSTGLMFSRVRRSMRTSPRDARPSGAPLPAEEVQAGLRRLESITARSQQDSKGRYEHPTEHFPSFIDHGFSGFRKWRRTVEPIPTLSPEELEQTYATAGSNPRVAEHDLPALSGTG